MSALSLKVIKFLSDISLASAVQWEVFRGIIPPGATISFLPPHSSPAKWSLSSYQATMVRLSRTFLLLMWNQLSATVFPQNYNMEPYRKNVKKNLQDRQRVSNSLGVVKVPQASVTTFHHGPWAAASLFVTINDIKKPHVYPVSQTYVGLRYYVLVFFVKGLNFINVVVLIFPCRSGRIDLPHIFPRELQMPTQIRNWGTSTVLYSNLQIIILLY